MRRREFLKAAGAAIGFFAAGGTVLASERRKLPNIVFFLADDMGIGDTSAYQDWTGNSDDQQIYTPNMERLAKMGVRFTDAHTSSTVCSPTRYALLTGRYSWRTSLKHSVLWGPQANPLIEKDRPTIATLLRKAGYHTGISGKWHVGLQYSTSEGKPAEGWLDADVRKPLVDTPLDHGFDYCFITSRSHPTSSPPGWIEDRKAIGATGENRKSVEGYANNQTGKQNMIHARKFLDEHIAGAETKGKPFFLYYAANANHLPHTPTDEIEGVAVKGAGRMVSGGRNAPEAKASLTGKVLSKARNTVDRIDFVYENDVALGLLLHFLETTDDPRSKGGKLIDNTLVIFSSDNGSEKGGRDSVGPLRGKKAKIWEGGHRVPFIAMWAKGGIGDGRNNTAGATSDELIGLNDMFATFAALTGQSMDGYVKWAQDSEDRLEVLRGGRKERGPLVLHDDGQLGPVLALREGPWKLVVSEKLVRGGVVEPIALFNLSDDRLERPVKNLIEHPGQAARIKRMSETLLGIFRQGFDPEIIYKQRPFNVGL